MKRSVTAALLLSVATVVAGLDFHPGNYPTLKLQRISQKDLTASLGGYVVIRGRIEAVWEAGADGLPAHPGYFLLPDAQAANRMPTLDDYRVTKIRLLNGIEALRLAAGPDVASAFEKRETLRVTVLLGAV